MSVARVSDVATAPDTRRQLVLLVGFAALAVILFAGTRMAAGWHQRVRQREAVAEYTAGQLALSQGHRAAALDALRQARALDSGNARYARALATALVQDGQVDQAVRILQAERERTPEDPDINLALARSAAAAHATDEAVRYYHHAIFGIWPTTRGDEPAVVRFELVRYLIAVGQHAQADAELLSLASVLPRDAGERRDVADLLAQAGDPAHALDQYVQVLARTPDDATALAGAGAAAFELGNLPRATRWLRQARAAGDRTERTDRLLAVVGLVDQLDPLAAGLRNEERRQRLVSVLDVAAARADACLAGAGAPDLAIERARLQQQRDLVARRAFSTGDIVDALVLIDRVETAARGTCGEPQGQVQAVALIAQKHGGPDR